MLKDLGIYIHIPFCKSKCYYCDFNSSCNITDELISRYIDALCKEILENSQIISENNITSIYFGGGTPSYIDSKYIKQILETINYFRNLSNEIEITIEVNPCSTNLNNKLIDYKNIGINRISIGLQSTHDNVLKKIGRAHLYSDFLNALNYCKNANFTNISADLIYPLPGLTTKLLDSSLDELMNLKDEYNIKHISIYNLEVHENTKLEFLLNEKYETLVDEDEEILMKRLIEEKLKINGYNNYEISNFAIDNFESIHNTHYWNQGEYLGFGVSAASFFSSCRYQNISNIQDYIFNINNNISIVNEKTELDEADILKEYVILKSRLKNGINLRQFKLKFKVDFKEVFKEQIEILKTKDLIIIDDNNFYLNEKGKDFANIVWQEFI